MSRQRAGAARRRDHRCESLAILEYLAEAMPSGCGPRIGKREPSPAPSPPKCTPASWRCRRTCRSGRGRTPEVEKDIRRIVVLWEDCRCRFGEGGPFLFGRFSMRTPCTHRWSPAFNTYGVDLHGEGRAYADAILALPPMQEWFAAGKAEPWSMPENDAA